MSWAVVRVRGSIHAKHDIVKTLSELRLNRPNHVAILPESPSYKGMADKVQGYVTWGPVSEETITLLHEHRMEEVTHSQATKAAEPKPKQAPAPKAGGSSLRMFRLHPPKGGWKSTKKPYSLGGALGFRPTGGKDDMDALIRRML